MKTFIPYKDVLRIVTATEPETGIALEYEYLSSLYGQFGENWKLHKQILRIHRELDGSEIPVDVFQIELKDGSCIEICIDVSSFYKQNS